MGELREQLQQEGLPTQGLKAELVERLYALVLQGESHRARYPAGLLGGMRCAQAPSHEGQQPHAIGLSRRAE